MSDPKTVTDPRIRSVDVLKGAAIIGVVFAHLMFFGGSVDSDTGMDLGEFFYAALPMFIVMSGYFHRPERGILNNLKKRVLLIFVVIIVFTIGLNLLMYGYMCLLGYDLDSSELLDNIIEMVLGKGCFQDINDPGYTGTDILAPYEVSHPYYFLQILAVGSIIFYLVADWALKDVKRVLASVIILTSITALYMEFIHVQLPFLAQLGPLVAAYLLIGASLGKNNVADYLENGYREKRYWIIFMAFTIIAIVLIYLFPTHMALIYSEFGDYGGWSCYTFMLISVTAGMSLFYLAALASKIPLISQTLCRLGRDSLWIFLLHVFIAKLMVAPFAEIQAHPLFPIEDPMMCILLAIITIVAIELMIEVKNRMCRPSDSSKNDEKPSE